MASIFKVGLAETGAGAALAVGGFAAGLGSGFTATGLTGAGFAMVGFTALSFGTDLSTGLAAFFIGTFLTLTGFLTTAFGTAFTAIAFVATTGFLVGGEVLADGLASGFLATANGFDSFFAFAIATLNRKS